MDKSKIGIIFVSLYLIVTIIMLIYSYLCSGMYCGLVVLLPIMPWPLVFERFISDSFFVFFILVALNSIILYYLGWLVSLMLRKINLPKMKK